MGARKVEELVVERTRWYWTPVGVLVAASLAITACGPFGSSTADSTAPTERSGSDDSSVAEIAPPTTVVTAPTQTTIAATMVDSTTSPPTTQAANPCVDFDALSGYERMMAVKNGTTPDDPSCKAAVDRSALALNTYETSLAFSEKLADTERDTYAQLESCSDGVFFSNVFDVPLIFWGLTTNTRNDVRTSYEPFITEVVLPGKIVNVPIPRHPDTGDDDSCSFNYQAIVAPVDGLASGIDGPPAPPDDPQASDDAQVWGAALLQHDSDDMDVAEFVNLVEDIHSSSVGRHLRELASPPTTEPGAPAITVPAERTYTVCGADPADLGSEVAGEYVWLRYASEWDDGGYHAIGLMSRGADRLWRFLGRVRVVDENVDPADPCTFLQRSTG